MLSLVEDHVVPPSPLEGICILQHKLVRCDDHIKTVVSHPATSLCFSLLDVTIVGQDLEARQELLELHLPVEHDRSRNDNQMRTPDFVCCGKVSE